MLNCAWLPLTQKYHFSLLACAFGFAFTPPCAFLTPATMTAKRVTKHHRALRAECGGCKGGGDKRGRGLRKSKRGDFTPSQSVLQQRSQREHHGGKRYGPAGPATSEHNGSGPSWAGCQRATRKAEPNMKQRCWGIFGPALGNIVA